MSTTEALHRLADVSSLLVRETDLAGVLARIVADASEATGAASAGLLVLNRQGELELLSATSHRTADLEAWQAATGTGPCVDCLTGDQPVSATLAETAERWPAFGGLMEAAGYHHVLASPAWWHGRALGGLNLFWSEPTIIDEETELVARALTDAVTLAVVAVGQMPHDEARERLDTALLGRVSIEQAKGVLAQREELTMEQAFARLLALAGERGEPLGETARFVVERAHRRRAP